MRFSLILCTLVAAPVDSAPALVWSSLNKNKVVHNSALIDATSVISSVLRDHIDEENMSASSLESVIFIVGRGEDGSESFTELAASGNLPAVSKKYNDASTIYHNVDQVESIRTITKAARDAVTPWCNCRGVS